MDLSTAIGRLVVIAAVLKRGPRYGFNTTSPMPLALLDRPAESGAVATPHTVGIGVRAGLVAPTSRMYPATVQAMVEPLRYAL
jgi:hypothetical protein